MFKFRQAGRFVIFLLLVPTVFMGLVPYAQAQTETISITNIYIKPTNPQGGGSVTFYVDIYCQTTQIAAPGLPNPIYYVDVSFSYDSYYLASGGFSWNSNSNPTYSITYYTQSMVVTEGTHTYAWAVSQNLNTLGNHYASDSFTVTPSTPPPPTTYPVTISTQGLSSYATHVYIDGTLKDSMSGGSTKKYDFSIGTTHSISVDPIVNASTGTRYYCSSNTWTVSSESSNTFNYVAQYLLTIDANPPNVSVGAGSRWYGSGESATTSTAQTKIDVDSGTQYAFQGWNLDGSPTVGNPVTVIMDKPHTVTAVYKIRYYLKIVTSSGGAQGEGWYNQGDAAQFSVPPEVPLSSVLGIFGAKYIFESWTGDYTGTSPSGTITMNGPHTITANWRTEYGQAYLVIGVAVAIVIAVAALALRGRHVPKQKSTSQDLPSGANRFCPECGSPIPADAQYCPKCSKHL